MPLSSAATVPLSSTASGSHNHSHSHREAPQTGADADPHCHSPATDALVDQLLERDARAAAGRAARRRGTSPSSAYLDKALPDPEIRQDLVTIVRDLEDRSARLVPGAPGAQPQRLPVGLAPLATKTTRVFVDPMLRSLRITYTDTSEDGRGEPAPPSSEQQQGPD